MRSINKMVKKFLSTFASAGASTVSYVSPGVNGSNLIQIRAVLPAMIATNTTTVQLPPNVDPGMMPLAFGGNNSTTGNSLINFTPAATPGSTTYNNAEGLQITTHNTSTGVTTLTAMGTIAAGDEVIILYSGGE